MSVEKKDIIIITDFEQGHVYPLFKIARNLEGAGYSICFVGIIDTIEVVRKNGFSCFTIFEDIFPKGYVKGIDTGGRHMISPNLYMKSILEELEKVISILQPKIVFTNSFLSIFSIIIFHCYNVKQVILHTLFPPLNGNHQINLQQHAAKFAKHTLMELDGKLAAFYLNFFESRNISLKSFEDLLSPLKSIPQIMLCPRELNINNSGPLLNEYYLGPCIEKPAEVDGHFMSEISPKIRNKKVIYVSFGSQTKIYPEKAQKFLNTVIDAINLGGFKNCFFVVSLGSKINDWDLAPVPENAQVFGWVPQLQVLRVATMAIIHGGLGSIKECIWNLTPMLIIPLGRDQFDNAKRVEHHKIGYSLANAVITSRDVAKRLHDLFDNKEIKSNILKMRNSFMSIEEDKKEIELVQDIIA